MLWVLLAAIQGLQFSRAISLGLDKQIDVLGLAHTLQARQSNPDVPAECQSLCNPVNSAIAAGCTFANCCTSPFETGYFNCFQCVAQTVNITDFSAPQELIDGLLEECAQHGFAIPKLTFPGQDPDRSLSTLPVSGTVATVSNIPSTVMSVPASTTTIGSGTALNPSTVLSIPIGSGSASSNPLASATVTGLSSLQATSTLGSSLNSSQSILSTPVTANSLNSATGQSTVTSPVSSSAASSAPQSSSTSQSSGTNSQAYHPVSSLFAILLLGYWVLV